MIKILTTIRRKLCNHSLKYSETIFNIRTHEVMAYGYECEKCGALFIVPQHMEQAKQPEKEVNEWQDLITK